MSACKATVVSPTRPSAEPLAVNRPCVAVAYSAGRDSTALLHATAHAACDQGLQVVALHVHHGLSSQADTWLAHAQTQCEEWARKGLPVCLLHHRVASKPLAGDSIEAWARQVRYLALRQMAGEAGAPLILLAHHRRDQAETWLLQALRGSGIKGLAAMPKRAQREGFTWARPWLDQSREAIEAYVLQHRLRYVDDDSNADPRHARNRLRLRAWPALVTAFPQAEQSLADAARWAQQARECLDDLAEIDLVSSASTNGLSIAAWAVLSEARRSNALRAWLQAQMGESASAAVVERLLSELPHAKVATWQVPTGTLRCYRGRLRFEADTPSALATPEATLCISRAGRFKLPGWGGELVARRVKEGGVPLAWLAHLELRARAGGEQFQAGLGRPARSLKKQYQAVGVPAWQREGPLIYSGGQLVFVPGLGIDTRVIALPGQAQLSLEWLSLASR